MPFSTSRLPAKRAAIPAIPLAVAGLAATPAVHAQVLSLDIDDVSISSATDRIYWDFDTGRVRTGEDTTASFEGADFYLKHFANNAVKPQVSAVGGGYGGVAVTAPAPEYNSFAGNFGLNESIYSSSPGVTWLSNANFSNGEDASLQWPGSPSTRGYLGLRFSHDNGGTFHYGWADITYADAGATLTLHAFGYESTADVGILAGVEGAPIPTPVPEPSTYAALAGLLAGSAALYQRRRRNAA